MLPSKYTLLLKCSIFLSSFFAPLLASDLEERRNRVLEILAQGWGDESLYRKIYEKAEFFTIRENDYAFSVDIHENINALPSVFFLDITDLSEFQIPRMKGIPSHTLKANGASVATMIRTERNPSESFPYKYITISRTSKDDEPLHTHNIHVIARDLHSLSASDEEVSEIKHSFILVHICPISKGAIRVPKLLDKQKQNIKAILTPHAKSGAGFAAKAQADNAKDTHKDTHLAALGLLALTAAPILSLAEKLEADKTFRIKFEEFRTKQLADQMRGTRYPSIIRPRKIRTPVAVEVPKTSKRPTSTRDGDLLQDVTNSEKRLCSEE